MVFEEEGEQEKKKKKKLQNVKEEVNIILFNGR